MNTHGTFRWLVTLLTLVTAKASDSPPLKLVTAAEVKARWIARLAPQATPKPKTKNMIDEIFAERDAAEKTAPTFRDKRSWDAERLGLGQPSIEGIKAGFWDAEAAIVADEENAKRLEAAGRGTDATILRASVAERRQALAEARRKAQSDAALQREMGSIRLREGMKDLR